MFAAMPAVFLVLAALYFGTRDEWRIAWMKAAVVTGLVVVAITEALSLVRLLSLPAVVAAWLVACAVAVALVWRRRVELSARGRRLRDIPRPPATLLAAIAAIALIVAGTGVTAWVAPPNTYDSMTYHMARVAHWAADGTVAHYPTNILRQLYQAPGTEFGVLQLQVLYGGDQLANLVQWFAMVTSVIAASVIALQLGAPMRGQLLASIVVATLPMGILQASSTQTDYAVALWLVCSVAMALRFVADRSMKSASWFAASLGLAMLTKGTAFLFAAPLVILLGGWMLIRLRKQLLAAGLVMIFIPLLINSGYFLRNEALFRNPVSAPQESAQLVNGTFTPQAVLSNVLRDAADQFGTTASVNDRLTETVAWVHANVLHISPDDPLTTSPGATFRVTPLSFDEDYAGDPLHALLALVATGAGIGWALRRGPPLIGFYAGALTVAFVLFAGYLRWQPWITRLELPLLVLAAPLIGAIVSRVSGAVLACMVAGVLVVAAVPWVIDNQTRPLAGFAIGRASRSLPAGETIFNTSRADLYFVKRRELKVPYVNAVERAKQAGCAEIGLWSGADDWEYPLWVLAQASDGRARVDQVFVTNESAHAVRFGAVPCMLVAVVPDQPATVDLGGITFTRISSEAGVGVYEPS